MAKNKNNQNKKATPNNNIDKVPAKKKKEDNAPESNDNDIFSPHTTNKRNKQ